MKTKRFAELSVLTALALILFIIELKIPRLSPIEGVKLGLANIVTVYAVYHFKVSETILMVTARIILGAVFSGNFSSLLYSASGAFMCLVGMLILKRIIPENYIWLSSIIGAVFHNTGQIITAVFIMGISVISYYPILIVSGCIAGFFTGITAQLITERIKKIR